MNFTSSRRPAPAGENSMQGGSLAVSTQNKHSPNVIQLPVGGCSARRPTSWASSPSDFLPLPPEPFVARHPIVQALIDLVAIAVAITFVVVTTGAIVASVFLLLFCRF